VLLNLLSNGIKYNRRGGSVRISRADGPPERMLLLVTDTGRGIPEDRLVHIFSPFDRLGAEQTGIEGTGLGLTLARQLIEAHGGTIGVESQEGQGSRFSIVLPVGPAAPEPVPVTNAVGALNAAMEPAGDGQHVILVIEDDPSAAELLRVYLEEAGYTTAIAPDGRTGIEWATSLKPAAIILDILLPDLDGWEVLQRVKQAAATRDIPVIVVSVVDDAPLGFALGAKTSMRSASVIPELSGVYCSCTDAKGASLASGRAGRSASSRLFASATNSAPPFELRKTVGNVIFTVRPFCHPIRPSGTP
jgi:CheY-like chemotaxis protein